MDAFGHKQLSGTANYLACRIANELNCKARGIELSTLQRAASHLVSRIDIIEAFQVGGAAVKAAYDLAREVEIEAKNLAAEWAKAKLVPKSSTAAAENVSKQAKVFSYAIAPGTISAEIDKGVQEIQRLLKEAGEHLTASLSVYLS